MTHEHQSEMDTRRTMEEVFKAWLYDGALNYEERTRLYLCARDIMQDERRGWPYHFQRDDDE
jgi:hypothetical protein